VSVCVVQRPRLSIVRHIGVPSVSRVSAVLKTCSHKICDEIGTIKCGVNVVVHDGENLIVGIIGLGKHFGSIGTCSGHCEQTDTCVIATARRELYEEFKISLSDDEFEKHIERIVRIDSAMTILFNFRGLDFATCQTDVRCGHAHAREILHLETGEQCALCSKKPNETFAETFAATNGEMSDLMIINIKDIYTFENFQAYGRIAIVSMMPLINITPPMSPFHTHSHNVVKVW
jgi:8-oxo-dGTP pyrophosphatase MutT (NUDIX family)